MESIIIRGEVVTLDEFMVRYHQGIAKMMPLVEAVQASLGKESDRGAALSGAAFLDDAMKGLLKTYFQYCVGRDGFPDGEDHERIFRDLSSVNGPLGLFSNRANMLYMLNLITPQHFKDLKTVARLRNKFAHILEVSSFADATIVDLVSNFAPYVNPTDLDISGLQVHELNKVHFNSIVADVGISLLGKSMLIAEGLPVHYLDF